MDNNENKNETFLKDQAEATTLAQKILNEEIGTSGIAFDALNFAFQYHSLYNNDNISIEAIIKTANTIKKFLQKI